VAKLVLPLCEDSHPLPPVGFSSTNCSVSEGEKHVIHFTILQGCTKPIDEPLKFWMQRVTA
jgi:hypothetical protein